ncbi:aminoglycoside phosphotransferase family protein [Ovoidimarina sediminis]|uniref:aminoglycoside phosphotransferase family protein n=1 Tax=Ovoidimarina sediminis TaxID=3079856 RepID=UPI002907604F|nr:phosphotransferase [Rhodophyticola sp. MJ-SS7]MDU8942517.1 phosphotransferase [Rhodophyticola sp. MJ-SS7]
MSGKGAFLAARGWAGAEAAALAGDASRRSYERLVREDGARAVLMIAPPASGEDTAPFVAVAGHLERCGLGAPKIYGADREAGFLLLEDFGDALFARVAEATPALEPEMYRAAADVLIRLHDHPLPEDVPAYDSAALIEAALLAVTWYAGEGAEGGGLAARLADAIAALDGVTRVLALRDYHAENLIWLPDRPDILRVGLLDFQDAMAGHAAYDLVSLLQDARRDVDPEVSEATFRHFLDRSRHGAEAFGLAYATLGAQRNLRILGVFARLCLRDEKPQYLRLIPRVWGHLEAALSHPKLSALRAEVMRVLPAPDATHLGSLEARCGQMRP